jgi:hypothetical protein
MDKFPEAFARFEKVVDVNRIISFQQLLIAFKHWAGEKFRSTEKQIVALIREAQKRNIPVPLTVLKFYGIQPRRISLAPLVPVAWRHELVVVRGKPQDRYRNLKTGRFMRKSENQVSGDETHEQR